MRSVLATAVLAIGCGFSSAQDVSPHNYKPLQGYVPDEATAIKIALAVWEPIYGADVIRRQSPYSAKLVDGVWHVSGTLQQQPATGGVAMAQIAKDDGKVLRITHGK